MSLEHVILGFLCERPRSGYDLKTRCFDPAANAFWGADQAQIYRTLERLQAEGHVQVSIRRTPGKPDRKIYRPSPSGRAAFLEWATKPLSAGTVKEPLLAQLFLGELLTDDEIVSLLEHHVSLRMTRLNALDGRLAPLFPDSPSAVTRSIHLQRAALSAARAREKSAIDWANECIESIRSGGLPPLQSDQLDVATGS